MTTTDASTTTSSSGQVIDGAAVLPQGPTAADVAALPHDCEPETVPDDPAKEALRLIGIDVARAVAVLGMIAVHVLDDVTASGAMSTAFVFSAGKSSALFAVLAGLGIALSTGRSHRPTGRRWRVSVVQLVVRALLIGLIGLALGQFVPTERAAVILAYYAALFVMAIPMLRLSARALAVLAVALAVAMPFLSHWLRSALPVADEVNLSTGMFLSDPVGGLQLLVLTGEFPAITWVAYVAAGLAIGRAAVDRRVVMVLLTCLGAGVAVLANAASWFLMGPAGGLEHLAAVSAQSMTLESFTDLLVWGGNGVTPTDSLWWLAVLAPHTGTPVDLLFTMGIAVAVIGAAMMLGLVAPEALRPLAAFGSMPLTLYTLHLLLLLAPFIPEQGGFALLCHVVVLSLFVVLWRKVSSKGPLEHGVATVARWAGRLVKAPYQPRHEAGR